jgi:transposase, IS5 family
LQTRHQFLVESFPKNKVFMKGKSPEQRQTSFVNGDLATLLNPRNKIYILANNIPWPLLEKEFSGLYSNLGQPAKPIRLMTGLLILKQMHNLSDDNIVEAWKMNPYFQYFCGETEFQWDGPCDSSDLTYFRNRIGEKGAEKILELSIQMHPKAVLEKTVIVDTTVQEKNITFPTDLKLHRKIIERCRKIAKDENVRLRQTYKKEIKELVNKLRFEKRKHSKKAIKKYRKRVKTIAMKLVREISRKLPESALEKYANDVLVYLKVIGQKRDSKNKIYSLHETHVQCIAKGKDHKKYEFGTKTSFAYAPKTGVIVGALAFENNPFDGHTLEKALDQTTNLLGTRPSLGITDRGYRGQKQIKGTTILYPNQKKIKDPKEKKWVKENLKSRSAIEAIIGHLKSDFRLQRNYLKGFMGDSMNAMLAAAAFNFKYAV